MPKQETGITDTGESEDPLNLKRRRASYGHQQDAQAAMGDGDFAMQGQRRNTLGKPLMLPLVRRRRGMR